MIPVLPLVLHTRGQVADIFEVTVESPMGVDP